MEPDIQESKSIVEETIVKNPRGLHTLSIGTVWAMAKELAGKEDRTVSSYIREVIKRLYEENKQEQPTT